MSYCRMQASPLPESEKENITFCRIGPAHEPNTGERDEQTDLFGQGRSPERQRENSNIVGVLTVVVVMALAAAVAVYGYR